PVIDGTIYTEHPLDLIAHGNAAGVHLMTGTNRHEMTLFQLMDPRYANLDEEGLRQLAHAWFGTTARDELVAGYRERRPGAPPQELWLDLSTDRVFRIPAIHLAEAQLGNGPVWMYRFTWETPVFGGALRCTHALEIPFVFDNLAEAGSDMFLGTGPERQ